MRGICFSWVRKQFARPLLALTDLKAVKEKGRQAQKDNDMAKSMMGDIEKRARMQYEVCSGVAHKLREPRSLPVQGTPPATGAQRLA